MLVHRFTRSPVIFRCHYACRSTATMRFRAKTKHPIELLNYQWNAWSSQLVMNRANHITFLSRRVNTGYLARRRCHTIPAFVVWWKGTTLLEQKAEFWNVELLGRFYLLKVLLIKPGVLLFSMEKQFLTFYISLCNVGICFV